jgi:hypothetical protein
VRNGEIPKGELIREAIWMITVGSEISTFAAKVSFFRTSLAEENLLR